MIYIIGELSYVTGSTVNVTFAECVQAFSCETRSKTCKCGREFHTSSERLCLANLQSAKFNINIRKIHSHLCVHRTPLTLWFCDS